MAEAGYPGFEVTSWFGLLAPAGTPVAVVTRINAETTKALALPDVERRIEKAGLRCGGWHTRAVRYAHQERSRSIHQAGEGDRDYGGLNGEA